MADDGRFVARDRLPWSYRQASMQNARTDGRSTADSAGSSTRGEPRPDNGRKSESMTSLTRRGFVGILAKAALVGGGAAIVAACQQPTPTPTTAPAATT